MDRAQTEGQADHSERQKEARWQLAVYEPNNEWDADKVTSSGRPPKL